MFECISCQEASNSTPRAFGPYDICEDCAVEQAVPKFEKALTNELCYPPTADGSGNQLDLDEFIDLMPGDFRVKYKAKKREYAVPHADRTYCQNWVQSLNGGNTEHCATFIPKEPGDNNLATCPKCRRPTCRRCRRAILHASHSCDPDDAAKEPDPFADMQRGDD